MTPPIWPAVRLGLLLAWAALTGYLLGRHPDRRDWQLSYQTTRIVMTDPTTGIQETQEQSGAVETLTTPDPNAGKTYNLFGEVPKDEP